MSRARAVGGVAATLIVGGAVAFAAPVGGAASHRAARVVALRLTEAPTPRLPVRGYKTTGDYAQVRGADDLARVNAALRRVVIDDERAYAPVARRHVGGPGSVLTGIYHTAVDPKLVSASTVVVSVLMPADELFPGGDDGATYVAGTVMVPSGRRMHLNELFAHSRRAPPVLARDFKRASRREDPRTYRNRVSAIPSLLRPTAHNYRLFALLPTGLTVGVPHGICPPWHETIPYARCARTSAASPAN